MPVTTGVLGATLPMVRLTSTDPAAAPSPWGASSNPATPRPVWKYSGSRNVVPDTDAPRTSRATATAPKGGRVNSQGSTSGVRRAPGRAR